MYDRKSILARSKERILEQVGIIFVCVVVDLAYLGWVLNGPTQVCWELTGIEIGANYGS